MRHFITRLGFGGALILGTLNAAAISSGSTTITGTFKFDFDSGYETPGTDDDDVWWALFTGTERLLRRVNGATMINLGVIDFGTYTSFAQLQPLAYGTADISGNDSGNQLVPGDVFAVKTNLGNYARVLVTGPFDPSESMGLPIQWETYIESDLPEPSTFLLVGLTGALLFAFRRKY